MSQKKVLFFIIAMWFIAVNADDDGNSVSHEVSSKPQEKNNNYADFGPIHRVVPLEGKTLNKAPEIQITRNSILFPRLSPEDLKRHLELVKEFEQRYPIKDEEIPPPIKNHNSDVQPEDVPESEGSEVHSNKNEIPIRRL